MNHFNTLFTSSIQLIIKVQLQIIQGEHLSEQDNAVLTKSELAVAQKRIQAIKNLAN